MLHLLKQDFKEILSISLVCLLILFSDVLSQKATDGMIFIEGTKFHYVQQNRMREGLELKPFHEGPIGDAYIDEYWIDLEDFYIDKYEVTNRQFKKFLDATGYKPKWTKNFLKHWKNNTYPEGKGDHPVVYVDFNDAKAYAAWAGKALPSEAQWQYAAQGLEYFTFPWGGEWDPTKANVNTEGTKPVGSYPEGASPFGVMDMVGNVAEMTDSFQDDGWHWFSYLRGGSWFQSYGSLWYTENGLMTNTQRLKFWWLNPGFNRSPTIGFRCIKLN
jgi:formylglycine-generating enzyme required for sulfatase activity